MITTTIRPRLSRRVGSRRPLRRAAVGLFTVSSLLLAGCGAGGDNSSDSEALKVSTEGDYNITPRDEVADGGELKLDIDEIPRQLNPLHANSNAYTSTLWNWFNPQVMLFDAAGKASPNPAYLTDIKEENKDGKTTITYTIHPEAKYNDGTPIDWRSFESTWKAVNGKQDEYQISSSDGYNLIESVTKGTDDKQAVVKFSQEYPWWEGLFNQLLPPQVKDAQTFNEAFVEKAHPEWGAGPYKLEKIDFRNNTASFVPNELWWGNKPKLDRISYRAMDVPAATNAFRAGELDVIGAGAAETYDVVKQMEGVSLRTALQPANYLFVLNSKSALLKDATVRKAIMTGIDRSQLAAIRFQGLNYSEELPGSLTLYQTQEGYQDNFSKVVNFNAEEATRLLTEDAGYSKGSDGILERDGQRLSLRYVLLGEDQMSKATASALQQMMRDIGVDLQVVQRPSSDFSRVTAERDFDLFAMGFRSSDPFGVAYFDQMYNSKSELNKSGTGSAEFDKKIAELQKISDPEKQIERANELEVEAFENFGLMPYANGPSIIATKEKLANMGATSFAVVPKEDIGWEK